PGRELSAGAGNLGGAPVPGAGGQAGAASNRSVARWVLWVRHGGRQVGCRGLCREAEDRTVDVDPRRAVRSRLAGCRVNARQQIWPGRRQVEDDVLVNLPLV